MGAGMVHAARAFLTRLLPASAPPILPFAVGSFSAAEVQEVVDIGAPSGLLGTQRSAPAAVVTGKRQGVQGRAPFGRLARCAAAAHQLALLPHLQAT